jgi:DNA polymerase III alpha subunit (gram-positive type)
MKILFIDTETTGFSHKTQDMWQVAGFVTENQTVLDSFNIKCQPINWHTISKGALECQDPPVTIEQLKSYQKPREAFLEFKAVLDRHYDETIPQKFFIAGQNVKAFDWRFLNAFWNRHKIAGEPDFQHYFNNRVSYDLMDLTRPLKKKGILKVENVKLGTIIESFDIINSMKILKLLLILFSNNIFYNNIYTRDMENPMGNNHYKQEKEIMDSEGIDSTRMKNEDNLHREEQIKETKSIGFE